MNRTTINIATKTRRTRNVFIGKTLWWAFVFVPFVASWFEIHSYLRACTGSRRAAWRDG